MKVRELVEELKKVPEEYLNRTVMASIDVIEEDGRITKLINTGIKCVNVADEYQEDEPEEQEDEPEKPPKYFNDADVFFDRFLRQVG